MMVNSVLTPDFSPGRFGFVVDFPPLDKDQRIKVFDVHVRGMVLYTDVLVAELAARAEDFTGSDIAAVCQRAAMRRIHEFISAQESYDDSTADRFAVERADFEAAMEEVQRLKARVAQSPEAPRDRRPSEGT